MSEEKEIQNEEQVNEVNENQEETTIDASQEEAKTEVTPEDKYNELNDRFLRLYAEFENFRRRSNKERLDLIATANAGLLKDLLPIMDDFERAIANNATAEDIDGVKEGFNLIFNKFKNTIESKGVKQMEAKGQVFDSEFHEAIANVPVTDEKQKGKVIDDVEKGYLLGEKVIRYAKVVVGQ
ncbi:MAG: nucleotide exchange factor GrpE [Flavobacteriales bacterium]|nr:nucleotide exchange factor GrpE [Flavobacteriales bacterium]